MHQPCARDIFDTRMIEVHFSFHDTARSLCPRRYDTCMHLQDYGHCDASPGRSKSQAKPQRNQIIQEETKKSLLYSLIITRCGSGSRVLRFQRCRKGQSPRLGAERVSVLWRVCARFSIWKLHLLEVREFFHTCESECSRVCARYCEIPLEENDALRCVELHVKLRKSAQAFDDLLPESSSKGSSGHLAAECSLCGFSTVSGLPYLSEGFQEGKPLRSPTYAAKPVKHWIPHVCILHYTPHIVHRNSYSNHQQSLSSAVAVRQGMLPPSNLGGTGFLAH